MKKIVLLLAFMVFFVDSYADVTPEEDTIIVSQKDFVMIVPDSKIISHEVLILSFANPHRDIYPTSDKIVLSNERGESISLTFDKEILWGTEDDKTTIVLNNKRDRKKVSNFLSKSNTVDFHIYRTNTLYEVKGIQVTAFKDFYRNI